MKNPYWLEYIPPKAPGKPPLYQIVRAAQKIGLPMTQAQAQAEIARRQAQHIKCLECRRRARAGESGRAERATCKR